MPELRIGDGFRPLGNNKRFDAGACALLFAVTLSVYTRTATFDFVNYDDPGYVLENPLVLHGLTWQSVYGAFTQAREGNWFPFTWLSYAMDRSAFGLNPAGFHAVNVVLHVLNAVLTYLALVRLTGARGSSLAAAALFALHPLRVESVAWVAARKDVLSGSFFMLTLIAYSSYVRRQTVTRYLLVCALVAFGLMSKQTLVTLPCVLLLLDLWPLRRIKLVSPLNFQAIAKVTAEKIPMFALAALASLATYLAQSSAGATPGAGQLPLGVRVQSAAIAYLAYLSKTIAPLHLSVIYPHPGRVISPLLAACGFCLLFALLLAAWVSRTRAPYVCVGLLWFVGMLVPVIGLVQVGSQAYADRFTYLPHIGLFVAIVWAGDATAQKSSWARRGGTPIVILIISACALLTWRQVAVWKNSITLFEHAVRISPQSGIAINNLGLAYMEIDRFDLAEAQFQVFAHYSPDNVDALTNLGAAQLRMGRAAEAEQNFIKAYALAPNDPDVLLNWAVALADQGKTDLAIGKAEAALGVAPEHSAARQFVDWLQSGQRH